MLQEVITDEEHVLPNTCPCAAAQDRPEAKVTNKLN